MSMSRKGWGQVERFVGPAGNGGRSHKYGAVRTTTPDGVTHDSKGEAGRWAVLQQAQACGLIKDLKRQVSFDLVVNGVKVCTYRADFTYTLGGELAAEKRSAWLRDNSNGPLRLGVVEDFKGTITAEAKLKMRLFEAVMGYAVHIVKTPRASFG